MRRAFVPVLVGCACLMAPLAASAQDYTPSMRRSPFVPIDPSGPGVTVLDLHSADATSVKNVQLPFGFAFYGERFDQVSISRYGYVTFGRPGYDTVPDGPSDPDVLPDIRPLDGGGNRLHPLPNSGYPNGIVAAWANRMNCPAGSVRTRDAVIQGARTFTIEWKGCFRQGYYEPEGTPSATIEMQIRFTEGQTPITVHYGKIGEGASWIATAGIENPPVWQDATTRSTVGGTVGVSPTLLAACPSTGCDANAWPTDRVIQYGRPTKADLQEGTNENTGKVGLQVLSITGSETLEIQFENNIANTGKTAADSVTWDYYLSEDDVLDPEVDTLLLGCSHTQPESIPGLTDQAFTDHCRAEVSPGLYRFCTLLDPPGAITEALKGNNSYCSERFAVGTDVTGWLAVPEAATAGETMKVRVVVENRGTYAVPELELQIWLQDCSVSLTTDNVLAWTGTISLEGVGPDGIFDEGVDVVARPDAGSNSQANSICAVLVIDPDDKVDELDKTNNSYSSCFGHADRERTCAVFSRPDLSVKQVTTFLPDGCFYGDPIGMTATICNEGKMEARDFGLAFYLDTNSSATTGDTKILSVPQACDVSACEKIGDGDPVCLDGICHAPCESDTDCGTGGLTCEQSFFIPGKTCQLVLAPSSCRDVSINADIPTFNTRLDIPFANGETMFSAIVDWTLKINETTEFNNAAFAANTSCWIRSPDFAPVEIRTLSVLASGEVVPVYRWVRNLGVEPGDYTYRYVLSPNDTISANDLSLEIDGVGPLGRSWVDARSDDTGHDLVRLPDGIPAGTYYLGIFVDPDDLVAELREDNNVARSVQMKVVDASLRVMTTGLRAATVGSAYTVQMLAAGGAGAYSWSITQGDLPPGMKLETNGLLHGSPEEQGTYLFEVTVASGPNTASTHLVLSVNPAHGPLAVTLAELPPAFQGVAYGVSLTATGGVPPYLWDCPTKPSWLVFKDVVLSGTPGNVAAPAAVVCSVTDANGTRISRSYSVAVYSAKSVRITTTELAAVGVGDWLTDVCLAAAGGSGAYAWSVDSTTVPPGVGFENRENAGCFTGTPTACGTFLAGVTVADPVSGLTDTRQLLLTVDCDDLALTTPSLPAAERGAAYPVTRLVTNSTNSVVFEIASGELPRGLTLSANGEISGTVAVDARTGPHHLAVRFRDNAGSSGVAAVAINVLPDPVRSVTITKTSSGCSASGEGSAAGLLPFAAILAALLGLRRRTPFRPAAAGLAVAALLLPAVASAQFTQAYATHHRIKAYESLTTATVLDFTKADSAFEITPPWPVRFFGVDYTSFFAHENGLILFGITADKVPTATQPYPIPHVFIDAADNASPTNYIAGWWDDHSMVGRPGSFRHAVRGVEPDRELVLEWNWRAGTSLADPLDGGEHQVSIFENGNIAIRWGKIVDSGKNSGIHLATIGLMDAEGSVQSVPFLACSIHRGGKYEYGSCKSTDWNDSLRDTEAVFTTLPNLQVLATSMALEGLSGIEQTFTATVSNHGPNSTTTRVRFFVSTDGTLSGDDLPIGTSAPVTIGPFASAEISLTAPLPTGLAVGQYRLLALVDPDDEVKEFDEDDNAGGYAQFKVLPARPDLAVLGFGVPASGVPGSYVTADLAIGNLGNLDATDVPFWVVLSDNEVITASDFPIYQGTISVDWSETVERSVVATLPTNTRPGVYWVGLVVDPEGLLSEFDKLNNIAGSDRPFVVTVGGLVVTTLVPTSVEIGSEFCIPLEAEGGDGVYTWAMVDGALPPGVELIAGAQGASICGRPIAVGVYDFTLQVASASLTTRTQLTLEVSRTTLELSIGARQLPIAQVMVPYEASLLAFGGTPPYQWELVNGALPAGLSFHRDGLIFGAPLVADSTSLTVRVTDAANRIVTATITLPIAQPPQLLCSSRTLGTLNLQEAYTGQVYAAGGNGNLEWTTLYTGRYGDPGGITVDPSQPPPGLLLDAGTGVITGAPAQVGRYRWTLEVKRGSETDTCEITVDVVGGQGLAVATTILPNAAPAKEYRAQLKASGGEGSLQWTLATGTLPAGLSLDAVTGVVYGTPTAVLRDNESQTFAFQVEVRDSRNVKGTAVLSVTLAPEAKGTITVIERDEGCQAAGGGASLAALALVLVALRRRR